MLHTTENPYFGNESNQNHAENENQEFGNQSNQSHDPIRVIQTDPIRVIQPDPIRVIQYEPNLWIELNDVVIQSDQVSQEPRSPEDIPEVSATNTLCKLPSRNNRGKPPKRYVLEDGTSEEVIYHIANYTITEKLSEPLKAFVNQISSINVPEKIEEALKDHNWVKAMKEEMGALEKNGT